MHPSRPAYRPALYSCPFLGCKKSCKNPSGLTHHQSTCAYNPKNQFIFPPMQNNPHFPTDDNRHLSEPATPSPPRTPPQHRDLNPIPPTPSQATPRQNIWKAKGRSGIYTKTHPYLDGKSSSFSSIGFRKLNNYCRYSM